MQHGSTQQFLRPPGQRVAKRNARKEELFKCVLALRRGWNPRHGTAVPTSQKRIACPKASPNRSRHRYADPRRARRATAPERARRPFLLDRARPVFFSGKTEKKMGGALPSWQPSCIPRAVDNRPYAPAGVRRKSGGRTHRSAPTVPGRPAHPATNRRSPPGQ